MRFIFALGLAGPEGLSVPNESHAIAGMFAAIFEYELGDVGFARSPRFSAIMRSYCSFVVRASGRSMPRLRASSAPNRRRPRRHALRSYRAALRRALRPGPPTNLALRARANLQVRTSAKAKTTFRRQNHPRRPLPRWLTAR